MCEKFLTLSSEGSGDIYGGIVIGIIPVGKIGVIENFIIKE